MFKDKRSRFLQATFMLILLFCAQLSFAQNQKISLSSSSLTLKEAFSEIENQTGMSVDYDESALDDSRRINVSVKNETLGNALSSILSGSGFSFAIKNNHIVIAKLIGTQQNSNKVVINGVVRDDIGPLVGANVIEKGTQNGIVTDQDGKYSLAVSPGATIEVSSIGYVTKDIEVNNESEINVSLVEDKQMLEEIVVVGYGTARKKDLAGSVVRADLSALQESPNISIAQALHGTVPGLNVGVSTQAGSSPSISIRGRTSISGSNSPLIVLDGIIFRGSLVDINMNDVESIDILKDASAAAIYGSEASNGVILITSKTGKVMSKPVIEYSGSFSFQSPTNDDLVPEDREGFLRKIADRFLSESRTGDDLLEMNPDWDVTKHLMDNNALTGYQNGTDTDWWGLLTVDHPYIQNHNLSVRGRSELSSYFFSINYTDQKNLIINDTYKRYSVRLNLDAKITNWLKVGVQSFFTNSNYSGVSPNLYIVMSMPPIISPYDEDGNLIKQPYRDFINPLQSKEQDDDDKRYNLFAVFYTDMDFPFLKGLNYRMNFSQNLIQSRHFNFNEWGQSFTGYGYKTNSHTYNYMVDNILTYKNTFGKHSINATFVYGLEKRHYETTTAGAQNFTNMVLGYNYLDAGQADLQTASSSAWKESSLYTMFRVGYTYNDRYMFTGTVRRDGFSGFGKNHKYGVFPSAAFAWMISDENFFKDNVRWMNMLKLRISYGENGNRTVGRYQTLAKMGSSAGYLFGDGASAEQIQWMSSLANPDLKWESTTTLNFGADFGVLDNRIYGTIEYYRSKTKNLLFNVNIPEINGINSIPSNIGKLSNHGLEFNITGIPIKTKDLNWSITFNFSRNRNKVDKVYGIDNDGDGKEDDLVANKIFIGKPYGVCYDYNIIGMWQIADYNAGIIPSGFTYGTYKVEDINDDGQYTADADRKILGYTDPSYRFSIQNTISYKNWELKFLINSVQGGKKYYYGQPGSSIPNPDNIYQKNLFKFDYWTPENPNARYRQIGYYTPALGLNFSPYIQRNFVRLQDLTLSYTLPQNFLSRYKINRIKVYFTGTNLLTFTDWDGWDPESGSGLDTNSYPLMKSYTLGINLEF